MYIYLDDIMVEKMLTRYRIAKDSGIPYPTLDKIYKHQTEGISFATLERLCTALECTPNDILRFGDPPK